MQILVELCPSRLCIHCRDTYFFCRPLEAFRWCAALFFFLYFYEILILYMHNLQNNLHSEKLVTDFMRNGPLPLPVFYKPSFVCAQQTATNSKTFVLIYHRH